MNESFDITQAFEFLHAESETPWLGDVFLPPREFNLMKGAYSVLIMGDEGSGKTALETQLKSYAAQNGELRLLSTSWRPQLPVNVTASEQVADAFMSQIMEALSFAFLQTLVCAPEFYSSAPSWSQDFMHWFVKHYLQGNHEFHLNRLSEQAVSGGVEAATRLLSETPRLSFQQSMPASILPHLIGAVKALHFAGVWIFVDGMDALFRLSADQLEKFLLNFMSTLEYFEDPAFVFKIIAPRELGIRLQKARSVVTRRFKTYQIKWQEEELIQIVEKRAAFVLNKNLVFKELCKDSKGEDWLTWFKQYAGDTPRGWLDTTRPLLEVYAKNKKSLTKADRLNIYRQSPPPLHLDIEAGRTFLGHGEVTISAIGYKLLGYLYENRHRSCTKSELYYRAVQGLAKEPKSKEDAGWEDAPSWEGMMDTALYRLRQTIEWDEVSPLYIISERGQGKIRLENTA